jgi:ankyrin repeat protein
MDAFSTAASATALVGTCAYIARGLANLRKKLKRMDVTVSALETECWLISATFGRVAHMIKWDTDGFNSKFGSNGADDAEPIGAGLKSAIDCAMMLMAQLQGYVDKCNEKSANGAISISSKASYLWTEADMKDLLERARHLGQAVGTLLTAMQSDSLANVCDTMKANTAALHVIASRTRESYVASIKGCSQAVTPSNTSGMDNTSTASYYEEELIRSAVYKKAFQLRGKTTKTHRVVDEKRIVSHAGSISASASGARIFIASQLRQSVLVRNWERMSAPISRLNVGRLKSAIPWRPPESDTELDVRLRNSVRNNDMPMVEACLEQGADLEAFEESNGYRPLHIAVDSGRCQMVKFLLSSGANTASVDNCYNTALHRASSRGCTDCISALIDAGAEVNAKGQDGKSPLSFAASHGHVSAMNLLLSLKADVEFQSLLSNDLHPAQASWLYRQFGAIESFVDEGKRGELMFDARDYGVSPLTMAAMTGSISAVETLLKAGANINGAGKRNIRPIHGATYAPNKETLLYLLKNGADRWKCTEGGNSILHTAAQYGNLDAMEYLVSTGSDLADRNHDLEQPLHLAARHGQHDAVRMLLKLGASIESSDTKGCTPLIRATSSGRQAVVELLLENGANIEAATVKGDRPLHFSTYNNNLKLSKTLLERGASCECTSLDGRTPFHGASESSFGSIEMLQLLLDHGAQIDSAAADGRLPIHRAAKHGRYDLVRFLLNQGTDIDVEGANGRSPIHFAAAQRSPHTLALLIERGARVNLSSDIDDDCSYPIHIAANKGLAKNVRLLVNAGSDIDCKNTHSEEPLHLACQNGDKDTVKTLLESGANANATCNRTWSPLNHAADRGQVQLIDALVSYDASLNYRSINGNTILHFVCGRAKQSGSYEFALRLLELGASVNAVGRGKYTALHEATLANDLKMVKMLVQRGANIHATTASAKTPLDLAIGKGYEEIREFLVSQNSPGQSVEVQELDIAESSVPHVNITSAEDLQSPISTSLGAEAEQAEINIESASLDMAESAPA